MAQKHLKEVEREALRANKAREAFEDAILTAVEWGESLRDIEPYAGLKHAQVGRLAAAARERRKKREPPAD